MDFASDSHLAKQRLQRRTLLAGMLAFASSATAADSGSEMADVRFEQHPLLRVRVEMDIKGNVNLARNPLEEKPKIDALPLKSVATLDYEERPLAPENADELSEVVAGERFYHEAKSSSVLNERTFEKTLRDSLRHVCVRRETLPETLYSQENYFTQDELSLLRSPVCSLAVDHLLPKESIATGDRYEVDREALCSVLNLTAIDSGSVESKVLEVTAKEVRFALDGEFEASVDGVATRIRLLGKMTFSREHSICTWLAIALHETREIGKSEPGFDIAATIRMVRQPMSRPVALPADAAKVSFGQPVSNRKLFVELRCEEIKAGAMMPRSWKLLRDLPGSAVLRRIEHETNIAQCNLRTLVRLPEGSSLSLAEFQADVRRTLGDQLTRIDEGAESRTAQGLRSLRVVAEGESGGVPLRWIMLHLSDDAGRRLQATFTMAADRTEQFGADDFQLADSLRFLTTEPSSDPAAAEEAQEAAKSAKEVASKPRPRPRIAKKKRENANSSPSDLE